MLHWFAVRLARTGKRVGREEKGFTLIELLVVVIIIGILAAIAIPTFLNQRDSAEDSAAQTNLRNAATAQQAFFTNTDAYSNDSAALADYGFPQGGDPAVTISSAGDESYCMQAPGADGPFSIRQSDGAPVGGGCGA